MTQTFDATIRIDTARPLGAVHDHLYGANLEHIGRSVYQGHWAELLRNRKFLGHDRMFVGLSEGLSHQNPSYGVVTPWVALNPHHEDVLFVHDNTTFHTGVQSQRITIRKADGALHGVEQGGLTLRAGTRYRVRVTLKGEGQPAVVSLGDQVWTIPATATDWQEHETTLTPAESTDDARFSIAHAAEGHLWIGCASVMPEDTLDGHRPDVVAALKDWGPTFLRWPGGNFASAYRWEKGIGPRDTRPGYLDPAWNAWEPNDVGTEEFMELCDHVGAEPILTVNMGDGDAAEAARWVEYCNGGLDSPMGRLRAANGHPEPYSVRTWFVGNEQFGNWQVGTCDAETYARRYRKFAAAMLAVDPDLDLIAVGAPTDLYGHWNELVLKEAPDIARLSVHYYSIRTEKWDIPPPADQLYWPKVASAHEVCGMLDRTWEIVRAHADPPPAIAFDEWNTYVAGKAPDFFEDYGMADALYTGALMNACLQTGGLDHDVRQLQPDQRHGQHPRLAHAGLEDPDLSRAATFHPPSRQPRRRLHRGGARSGHSRSGQPSRLRCRAARGCRRHPRRRRRHALPVGGEPRSRPRRRPRSAGRRARRTGPASPRLRARSDGHEHRRGSRGSHDRDGRVDRGPAARPAPYGPHRRNPAGAPPMTQLSIRGLTKRYPGQDAAAIDGLDLEIESGSLVALLGPSGCGKTTTMKMIAGLLTPTSGDILFDGTSILRIKPEKRGAVMVFQNYLLFPT
jgi:hypothetical protein